MAEKMMRIAARGEDGLAKAVKADNEGNILVKVTDEEIPTHLTTQIAGEDLTRDRLQVGARPQYMLDAQSHINLTVDGNGVGVINGTHPTISNNYIDLRGYSEFVIIWQTDAAHSFEMYLRWGIDSGYSKTYETIAGATGVPHGINGGGGASAPTARLKTKAPYLQLAFKNKGAEPRTYNAWIVAFPHA